MTFSTEHSIVPRIFFEAPRHIRISFGCRPSLLAAGLANLSRALDQEKA